MANARHHPWAPATGSGPSEITLSTCGRVVTVKYSPLAPSVAKILFGGGKNDGVLDQVAYYTWSLKVLLKTFPSKFITTRNLLLARRQTLRTCSMQN